MTIKYEKYKSSGVEWLGEIPEHWQFVPFTKFCSSLVDYRGKTPEKVDNGIFLITTKNIKNGTVDYEISKEYIKEKEYKNVMSRGLPKINDVLFTMEAPLGEVALVDREDVALAQRIIKFRLKESINPRYCNYFMSSSRFKGFLYSEGTGSTALGIKSSKLHKLKILLLPLLEQQKIALYLDEKSEEINKFIKNKEELINLLEEEKKAIITQAVTKGLDKNVNFKNSGADWLGEIPQHWEVKRLKYLLKGKLKYGANEEATLVDTTLPRYIRITDFNDDGNLSDFTFRSLKNEIAKNYLLTEGDILFARSGATVGKTFQFKNYKGNACYAGYLIKATPNKLIKSDFLYIYTMSNVYSDWKEHIFIQSTIQNISAEKYANLIIPIPSLDEQKEILFYLNEQTKIIDDLKAKYRQEIDLIKEYKERLIYDVVTGKMNVLEH